MFDSSSFSQSDLSKKQAVWAIVAITLAAAVLRFWHIDSALWLDEVTPIFAYRNSTVVDLLTTYLSTNNHLLYTLLEKVVIIPLLGENEWSVRLPAVLFGIATIPLTYLLARLTMKRAPSVAATCLMAVSFHHIFFSQNARGYSGFLFCSMAAALFLIRVVRRKSTRDSIACIASMFGAVALLVGPGFALILANMITSFILLRTDATDRPERTRRLLFLFGGTLMAAFTLYSVILPQAIMIAKKTYQGTTAGFSLFSPEFLNEVTRGLASGFGNAMLLVMAPAVLVVIAGLIAIWRRNWLVISCLVLPQAILAFCMVVFHLSASPRFFLLSLPLAILLGVQGLDLACATVCHLLKRDALARPLFSLAILLGVLATVPSLIRYYSLPKQDFKAAVEYIKSVRTPPQIIMPIYTAEGCFKYYADRSGLTHDVDYFPARTIDQFNSVLSKHTPEQILIITSFPRSLHLDHPELEDLIGQRWIVDRRFPGTIGDGTVYVWKSKN